MVHPISNNLIEDLEACLGLITASMATALDGSGNPVTYTFSPAAAAAAIALILAKYDVVRMEDTIGMPSVHPQMDDLYFIEDKTSHA